MIKLKNTNELIALILFSLLVVALFFGGFYKLQKLLRESLYYVATFTLCEVFNLLLGVTLWISLSHLRNELTVIEKLFLCFAIIYMVFNTLNHIMIIYHMFHEVRYFKRKWNLINSTKCEIYFQFIDQFRMEKCHASNNCQYLLLNYIMYSSIYNIHNTCRTDRSIWGFNYSMLGVNYIVFHYIFLKYVWLLRNYVFVLKIIWNF